MYNPVPYRDVVQHCYPRMFLYACSQSVLAPNPPRSNHCHRSDFFSPQINFPHFRTSCEWNYIAHTPLYKASFTQHNVFDPYCQVCQKFLFFFFGCVVVYCVNIRQSIHSIGGYLGYFQFFAIMNKTAMYIPMSLFVTIFFHFSQYLVKFLGHCGYILNFIRNCNIFSQSAYTILHPYQQCIRVAVILQSYQYLVSSVF